MLWPQFRWLGQWLWLPAVVCGFAGVVGVVYGFEKLAALQDAAFSGMFLWAAPHVAGAVLASWAGRREPVAGAIVLAGTALMAILSWVDALSIQTDGFEWQANNAMGAWFCCGVNYLVLGLAVSAVSVIMAASSHYAAEQALHRDEGPIDA